MPLRPRQGRPVRAGRRVPALRGHGPRPPDAAHALGATVEVGVRATAIEEQADRIVVHTDAGPAQPEPWWLPQGLHPALVPVWAPLLTVTRAAGLGPLGDAGQGLRAGSSTRAPPLLYGLPADPLAPRDAPWAGRGKIALHGGGREGSRGPWPAASEAEWERLRAPHGLPCGPLLPLSAPCGPATPRPRQPLSSRRLAGPHEGLGRRRALRTRLQARARPRRRTGRPRPRQPDRAAGRVPDAFGRRPGALTRSGPASSRRTPWSTTAVSGWPVAQPSPS